MSPNKLENAIKHVEALAKTEAEAIGFLPRAAYHDAAATGRLYIAHAADDVWGFAVVGARKKHRRIYQACVRVDVRREHIATMAINHLLRGDSDAGVLSHVAHVAEELDAVLFWQQLGFRVLGELDRANTRGRRILCLVRPTPAASELKQWYDAHPELDAQRKLAVMAGMADAFDDHQYNRWLGQRNAKPQN